MSVAEYQVVEKSGVRKIKPGDKIMYTMRGGPQRSAFVSSNSWPNKINLINPINKFVWYIPLSEPSLKIWTVARTRMVRLEAEKDRIYNLYTAGKLILAKKPRSKQTKKVKPKV